MGQFTQLCHCWPVLFDPYLCVMLNVWQSYWMDWWKLLCKFSSESPTLTTTRSLTSRVSSSNWNCIPTQPSAGVCMCYTDFYDPSFSANLQSIMALLLLLHFILAEECLCKIVKFLMTPQEDDYKLCPTCRGYNVIKRNSLLWLCQASTFSTHHLLPPAQADRELPGEN